MAADFETLIAQLGSRQGAIEMAVLAVAFGLAWQASRPLRGKLPANLQPGALKIGAGSVHRVAFPLLALAFAWIGRLLLATWQVVPLLDLAITLVSTFAGIRLAVYLLRHALPPSPALKASERFIFYAVWGLVALYLTGVLPEFKAALEDVSFTAGKQTITLLMVIQASFWATVTVFIALTVSRLIEERLMLAATLDMSLRVFSSKLVRALAVVIAVLIALPIVGIDINVLSVFGGALGVGLGLGMQKIASNYVSGFAILLDRSIRPGDLVTIGERQGVVTDIRARYTILRIADGTDAIIPNDLVATTTVLNHTSSNQAVALKVPFTVAFGSDWELANRLAVDAARAQSRVLSEPRPAALLVRLGGSGIECELVAWIADFDRGQGPLRSAILHAMLGAFAEHGIEIPAQRRDSQAPQSAPANVS
jgi:small-conductance mechanosensitive channel